MPLGHQGMHKLSADTKRSGTAIWAVVWSAIDILIPTIVGFGVFILTSRFLTPAEFGTVALAGGVAMVASALCPAGFGTALVQKLDVDNRDLDTVFTLCVSTSLLVYLVECAVAGPLAVLFRVDSLRTLIPVLALRVIPEMAAVVPNALISKSLSFRTFAFRTLFVSLLASGVAILLLLKGLGIWALVLSQLTTTVVSSVVAFWATGWRPHFSVDILRLRRLSGYGLYASASRTMGLLVVQNELIFVGFALGTSQVGLYNFAKRLFTTLNDVVGGALSSVAHPFLSGIQDDPTRVRSAFLAATFASSVIAFPLFVGLAVTSDRIIPILFGIRWQSATGLVRLQCALGIITCIGVLQAALITSRGKAGWWFYYQLFSTVTTFICIGTFARLGTEIMLGSIVVKSYAIWAIPVSFTLRIISMSAKDYLAQFVGPGLASFAMALMIYLERYLLGSVTGVYALLADLSCGGVSYLVLILIFEKRRILAILKTMFPAKRLG